MTHSLPCRLDRRPPIASKRLRKAVEDAGPGAFYTFDYSTQEAVILVADTTVPLSEWVG